MTLTRRRVLKQRSIKEVRVTTLEVLSDGQTIPVYEPVQQSKRIKSRKYKEAIGRYPKDLLGWLQKGYCITHVKDIKVGAQPTDEEKLLRYTHKLLEMEKQGEKSMEYLIACTRRILHKQTDFSNPKWVKNRYISDENGLAIVSFSACELANEEQIEYRFQISYTNLYTFQVKAHEKVISVEKLKEVKFYVILSRGYLCIIWVNNNFCSVWDFTDDEDDMPRFLQFHTKEDLSEAYHVTLDHENVVIVTKDEEFYDSVFSSDDKSQRMTSYYSCKTGEYFSSKTIVEQIILQDKLEHVSDILFLDIPSNPKWMVLEWLLPEMTLSHVFIYKQTETGLLEKEGVFNFQNDFSAYKSYFGKLNEFQCKVFITRSPWRAFLWISWHHVMIIDLTSFEIVGILKTDLSRYKDFKNELHDFHLEVSRTAHRVTLFVKSMSDIVYFCRFNLVPTQTLKQLAMKTVIETYPPAQIAKLGLDIKLQEELLDAY